eukprot:6298-Heterococcus_DN1.PRE.2
MQTLKSDSSSSRDSALLCLFDCVKGANKVLYTLLRTHTHVLLIVRKRVSDSLCMMFVTTHITTAATAAATTAAYCVTPRGLNDAVTLCCTLNERAVSYQH